MREKTHTDATLLSTLPLTVPVVRRPTIPAWSPPWCSTWARPCWTIRGSFGAWADWIGVPRHTFSALLGAVTALGEDNARAFDYLRPGFDVVRERRLRELAGRGEQIEDCDLYPDVRPALEALREQGLWVGIAGNQTARAAELLRGCLLYTSPSPRDRTRSRMPSSA